MDQKPHWTKYWPEFVAQFATRPRILIACDFDGTLAPITARPEDARLSDETRVLLRRLAMCPGVVLAFVSGRELTDLRARVGVRDAFYCGNHGLEIEGGGVAWTHPEANVRRRYLAAAVASLRQQCARMDGVLIEDKGLTASVHWRFASDATREALRGIVADTVHAHPGLRLGHGKAVWELRPQIDWHKGAAIRYLLGRTRLEAEDAIFIGDDETDESGFLALSKGITVRVGEAVPTAAACRAHDPADAVGFLFCLFGSRLRTSVGAVRATA